MISVHSLPVGGQVHRGAGGLGDQVHRGADWLGDQVHRGAVG